MMRYAVQSLLSVFAMIYSLINLYACTALPRQAVDLPAEDVPIQSQKAIVNILQSRQDISLTLQQAVDLYRMANPGEYINVTTVGSAADYRVALRTRLLSGDRADVFHVFSGREARELSEHLADLSDLEWLPRAAEKTAEPLYFDGKYHGVPYSLECYGLLVNRDMFREAEISLTGIADYKGLEKAVEELAEAISEGKLSEDFPNLKTVTDFAVQDKAFLAQLASNIVLYGEFATPTDALLAEDLKLPHGAEAEKLFRMLMRYSPRGDWTSRDGLSHTAQLEDFAQGRTALLLCDLAGARQILALNPELEGKLSLLPVFLPGLEDGGAVLTGAPLWWTVNADSSEAVQHSAKKFLTWMYQSDSGAAVVAARFGAVSPWQETAKETGKSLDRQMLIWIDRGRTQPQSWREYPYDWGANSFADQFRAVFRGEKNWADMMQALRESWAGSG